MPSFLEAPVSGAYHLLSSLVAVLQPLTGPWAAVIAIVACTLLVRLCLLPLSVRAHRGLRARAALMPHMRKLTERHRDNPERLQRELAKLQAEHGTTLFAGMLPMFAQLPFFWLMYTLFSRALVGGETNQLISGTLLGAPLGLHWPVFAATPGFLVLGVLLAVVAWFSARLAASAAGRVRHATDPSARALVAVRHGAHSGLRAACRRTVSPDHHHMDRGGAGRPAALVA